MVIHFLALVVLISSTEINCQRNIRGSRLLKLDDVTTTRPHTIKSNEEPTECVPLDKCASLDWVVQNTNTIPHMSSEDVMKSVIGQICGFYGRMPKVKCPLEDEDDELDDEQSPTEDYDYDETSFEITSTQQPSNGASGNSNRKPEGVLFHSGIENVANQTQHGNLKTSNGFQNVSKLDSDMVTGRAIFDQFLSIQQHECKGHLLISHGPKSSNPLRNLKQLRLRGKNFRQMRKLKERKVIQMQTLGNCCWKIYSRPHFNGYSEFISSGSSFVPRRHPRSIKRNNC